MPTPDSIRILALIIPIMLIAIGLFHKPIFATIGYMCFVFWKTTAYFPVFSQINAEATFAIIILIRLFLNNNSLKKISPSYNAVNKYFLLFIGCIFLSYLFSINSIYSWDITIYKFIKVIIIYVMILLTIQNQQELMLFIFGFIGLYAYLVYEPVYGFITGTGGSEQYYGTIYVANIGILSGHVALANNMNQMIPLAFFMILATITRTYRSIAAISLCLFLVALIGSHSRGGVVGFAVFCAVLLYYLKGDRKTLFIAISICIGVFIFSETLLQTGSRISYGQMHGRFSGLIHGIEMVRIKYHIFGVGPGCFKHARGRYFGFRMDAHNLYGELIGELGIPGSIVWLFFIKNIFSNLAYVRKTAKNLDNKNRFQYYAASGLLASLIVRLVVSMGSHGLYFFYWYVIAALSIILRNSLEMIQDKVGSDSNYSSSEIRSGYFSPKRIPS